MQAQWGSVRQVYLNLYRKSIISDFVRKVAEIFITKIVLIGIALVTSIVIARILGPEGRGLYAVAMTISTIGTQLCNLGLPASNTYHVARDRNLLPALVDNSLVVSFVFGGLGVLLTWAVFNLWPTLAPVHGLLLALALIWIPFGLAYLLLQNLLLGIQEVRSYNKIELITQGCNVIFIGVAILFNVVNVEMVFALCLINLIMGFMWALWSLRPHFSAPRLSIPLFKANFKYGINSYMASFFSFLVLRIDLLMVKYILNAEQAGYYSIAITMTDMLFILPAATNLILFPKLSAIPDSTDRWAYTKKSVIGIGVIMMIFSGIAALLAGPIIRVFFGQAFVPAVPAFIWLLPAIIILSLITVFSSYIASNGVPPMVIFVYFSMLPVNIILNWKFLPTYGIIGASIASIITYFFCLTGIIYVARKIKG